LRIAYSVFLLFFLGEQNSKRAPGPDQSAMLALLVLYNDEIAHVAPESLYCVRKFVSR
jgi:hypothetical protein